MDPSPGTRRPRSSDWGIGERSTADSLLCGSNASAVLAPAACEPTPFKPSSPFVDIASMPRLSRARSARPVLLALVGALLLTGCATKMTEPELTGRLRRESQTVASRQVVRRVVPIYAQTKMEAWILRTEAKSSPDASPLSLTLSDGFRLGQRRRVDYVIGGPFPDLSERLILNGLQMNQGRALPGLRIIYVSPIPPTPALQRAASARRVRLEHRRLD